jgi:hypothetical protein
MRRPTSPEIPPDDDPRFQQWIRDIGPLQNLAPDDDDKNNQGRPVVAALATCSAIAGMGISIGVAWCLVFQLVTPLNALVFIVGGCAVAGFAFIYLVRHAS